MQYTHVKLVAWTLQSDLFAVSYTLLDGNVHQASIIFVVYSTVLYASTIINTYTT